MNNDQVSDSRIQNDRIQKDTTLQVHKVLGVPKMPKVPKVLILNTLTNK